MMNKPNIFILVFLSIYSCYSQKMTVVDGNNKKPIPFANYSLYTNNQLVQSGYCNDEGKLYAKQEIYFDLIKVSCIGYENIEVYKNKIINDTLLLYPTVYSLREVIIRSSKKTKDVFTLGYTKNKKKANFGAMKGMKICVFIENPFHVSKFIQSFIFKIYNRYGTKLGFKIHFLEKDTLTNMPGKELLTQDIIMILEGNNRKEVEKDVSLYNIEFPSIGAFVGIEWFGVLDEETGSYKGVDTRNGSVELNDGSDEFNTFIQDVFSFYPWENMEKFKNDSKEYTNFKKCPTPSFGIKVYKE